MTAITYDELLAAVENLVVDVGSQNLLDIFPQAINYAEGRLYRDFDLLSTRITDSSVTLTIGNREATIPDTIRVVEGISVITPAGNTPANGTRNVLERTSLDFLDFMYGTEATKALPEYFTLKNDTTAVFGPTPVSAYKIEITGTFQPESMSSTNQNTYLGDNYPDLLLAATMIFMTGWQQNFGASADNPQMAQSWENQYQILFKTADEEVQRQKSQNPNWSPFSPTPLSTPRT